MRDLYYGHVTKRNHWIKDDDELVKRCIEMYGDTGRDSDQGVIPKILHFIWLGKSQVPDTFTTFYLPQWEKLHPDYSIKLWTEKDVAAMKGKLVN